MGKFDALTKYADSLATDPFGEWVVDTQNDGSKEHPIQFPWVKYSAVVMQFSRDLYEFCEAHPEYEHTRCLETLEKSGISLGFDSMENADVSALDAKGVIALLMGAVSADRFCEGALLYLFEKGCVKRWLERLKTLDEG